MGKHIQRASDGKAVTVSYATVLLFLSVIGGLIGIWKFGSDITGKIATKADIDGLKVAMQPVLTQHESRLRDLELQFARFFGASQSNLRSVPNSETMEAQPAHFVLAQYPNVSQFPQQQQMQQVQRRVVVPLEMIEVFRMEPSRGGVYGLQGEDGRVYSLDDVMAALIRMHMPELSRLVPRK